MKNESLEGLYSERIVAFGLELKQTNQLFARLSTFRIAAFIAVAIGLYSLFAVDFFPWSLLLTVTALIAFGILIKRHGAVKKEVARITWLIEINTREIQAHKGDFSFVFDGNGLKPVEHPNASDLDLLGPKSLYQRLNRTTTKAGEEHLATRVLQPDFKRVVENQQIFKELSQQLDWRQRFQAEGLMKSDKTNNQSLLDWIDQPSEFLNSSFFCHVIWASPLVFLALVGAYAMALIPSTVPIVYFILQLGIIGNKLKSINRFHGVLSRRQNELDSLSRLLEAISGGTFNHEYMVSLQQHATGGTQAIKKFGKLIGRLDSRLNMVVGIALNGALLWDIRQVIALEAWKESYREKLAEWIQVIAQFEALSSQANYAFNHPDFCWPQPSEQLLKGRSLGHPFLDPKEMISNDFSLEAQGQLILLSGANMSGKSTFLRTLGLNMIMAQMGLPTCAKELQFKPIPVYSSMRITDSLQENESYFYAELKRLKFIIDTIRGGKEMMVLLDEILRGTNSNDKHEGSIGLIEQLKSLNTSGIVASHDVTLSALAEKYPGAVVNKCFEVENANGELVFDYKLRDGVCQNLNASYLMKKMGVIATDQLS